MRVGEQSGKRHFFEPDDEFPEEWGDVLKLYEYLAGMAFDAAYRSMQTGNSKDLEQARWYEGMATGLESTLHLFRGGEISFDMYTLPFLNDQI